MQPPVTTQECEEKQEQSRRPYEPPAVVADSVFETLALACGKLAQGSGACQLSASS
jgi:hypothetical protein